MVIDGEYVRLRFLIPFWGSPPTDGGGRFEIVLTEDSAEVLAKTENLTRWKVPHTMTRGSKNAGTEAAQKTRTRVVTLVSKFAKKVEKSKAAKKKKAKKDKKEKKEKKEKPEKEDKESVPASEALGPDDIRRTPAGHAAILKMMESLFDLDVEKFGSAPAFNDDGTCRMKFDGAHTITWNAVYKASPKVFESMHLNQWFDDCCIFFMWTDYDRFILYEQRCARCFCSYSMLPSSWNLHCPPDQSNRAIL